MTFPLLSIHRWKLFHLMTHKAIPDRLPASCIGGPHPGARYRLPVVLSSNKASEEGLPDVSRDSITSSCFIFIALGSEDAMVPGTSAPEVIKRHHTMAASHSRWSVPTWDHGKWSVQGSAAGPWVLAGVENPGTANTGRQNQGNDSRVSNCASPASGVPFYRGHIKSKIHII